jgi:outer membrane protease
MDVSLGVLDLKTDEAVAAAENATRGVPSCLNSQLAAAATIAA